MDTSFSNPLHVVVAAAQPSSGVVPTVSDATHVLVPPAVSQPAGNEAQANAGASKTADDEQFTTAKSAGGAGDAVVPDQHVTASKDANFVQRMHAKFENLIRPSEDSLYLGLGNVLYLQYLRGASVLFFLMGLWSLPNIVANTRGGRYTLATEDPVSYAAAHGSIANLGSREWTPAGEGFCGGRGFSALVCEFEGWGTDPIWQYQCGRSKVSVSSGPSLGGAGRWQYLFGEVRECSSYRVLCQCFPGYSGVNCETGTGLPGGTSVPQHLALLNATPSHGFCVPLYDWQDRSLALEATKHDRDPPGALVPRQPFSCSGRGVCVVRYKDESLRPSATPEMRYSFCRCDPGAWGADCSGNMTAGVAADTSNAALSVALVATPAAAAPAVGANYSSMSFAYGDFYNRPIDASQGAAYCNVGVAPSIVRRYISDLISTPSFDLRLPDVTCGKHGFASRLPVDEATGRLPSYTSYYRAQTAGVCMCEPGYAGEQCMGGRAVPDAHGWFSALGTLTLMFGCVTLYRQRKRMQQAYDDATVSPGDFTVFVDKLPTLDVTRDLPELLAHFGRYGTVHSIAAACDDEVMVKLQAERAKALVDLQVALEKEEARRRVREGAGGAVPVKLPPVTVPQAVEMAATLPPLSPLMFGLMTNPLAKKALGLRGDKAKLAAFVKQSGDALAAEKAKPRVRSFERCFVTFDHSASADACLEAYSTSATNGIFGARPTHGEELRFRGAQIVVKQAPEPDEVQWDSLDVGFREILRRRSLSYLFMVLLIILLYMGVQSLKRSEKTWPQDPPVVGELLAFVSTAVIVALNVVVGVIWKKVAFFEQHYNKGSFVRSVFVKTLLTQLFLTLLAATLGVYSFPLDIKNGYVQDWYATAGPFIFRLTLIESVLPPLLAFANPKARLLRWLASRSPSATARERGQRPPGFMLAKACAALLRTVIMCASFNAGLPVLNFAVAAGLTIRYFSDKWLLMHFFRLQRTGPELARSLEVSLLLSVLVQSTMAWATLMAAWKSSLVTTVILYIVAITMMWAVTGYLSWKWFRGRDCWGGSGPMVPCSAWLCCLNDRLLRPFHAVHEAYMRLVFGRDFFQKEEDLIDETAGKSYTAFVKRDPSVLRAHPYYMPERVVAAPELYAHTGAATTPFAVMTGATYRAMVLSGRRLDIGSRQAADTPRTPRDGAPSSALAQEELPGPAGGAWPAGDTGVGTGGLSSSSLPGSSTAGDPGDVAPSDVAAFLANGSTAGGGKAGAASAGAGLALRQVATGEPAGGGTAPAGVAVTAAAGGAPGEPGCSVVTNPLQPASQ